MYDRSIPSAFESGGAGLCSTLDDYAKFALMLLKSGEYMGRKIMSRAAVKYMISNCVNVLQSAQISKCWTWMSGFSSGNLMRICTDESQTSIFSSKDEYGWDGCPGTFFSNKPAHGIIMLLGAQQAGIRQLKMKIPIAIIIVETTEPTNSGIRCDNADSSIAQSEIITRLCRKL